MRASRFSEAWRTLVPSTTLPTEASIASGLRSHAPVGLSAQKRLTPSGR